jgi:hypothetical protein
VGAAEGEPACTNLAPKIGVVSSSSSRRKSKAEDAMGAKGKKDS